MDHKIRTFIALELADKSAAQAYALGQKLAESGAEVRWEPKHKLHVTLKFLGDVLNPEVDEVCRAVQRAVRELPAFTFELQGAGAFPSLRKPKSVWMGVGEGREPMTELARAVDDATQELGFPRELRAFAPHVTLGRVRAITPALGALTESLAQYDRYDAGKTFARSVTIFASHMARTGSSYTVLATAPLAVH